MQPAYVNSISINITITTNSLVNSFSYMAISLNHQAITQLLETYTESKYNNLEIQFYVKNTLKMYSKFVSKNSFEKPHNI
jgi:hypothetical protein